MVIIMISPQDLAEATITDENQPDIIIHEFRELLELFPDRPVPRPGTGTTPLEPGLRLK
jgi:hypothetical protein